MKFFSALRDKIRESRRFSIIFSLINSIIGFLLLKLFLPEWASFSVLIISIVCGFITDYYIRMMYPKKKKKDHQQLK